LGRQDTEKERESADGGLISEGEIHAKSLGEISLLATGGIHKKNCHLSGPFWWKKPLYTLFGGVLTPESLGSSDQGGEDCVLGAKEEKRPFTFSKPKKRTEKV